MSHEAVYLRFFLSILLVGLSLMPSPILAQIADPDDVSGLVFWVDASDVNGTGIQPADGATVTTWVDKSSGGNNLTTAAGTVTFEASGFDGVNPGLRFPLVARMAGANPFAGNFQNQMTVFFVNANVTLTNNFSLTLNGTNTGSNIADGRFSFHTPWIDSRLYFDAGACCGSTRLRGTFANALTETTLVTGLNDEPGNRQWLRVDGQAFQADDTGHNANVSRGVHLGDLPSSHTYNGRFAEVVVYNRALNLAEVEDVECYLLAKWKPSDARPGCVQPINVVKTSQIWNPLATSDFALPENDVRYEIVVTKPASAGLSDDSLFVVDSLPSEVTFFNGDVDGGGPETDAVGFSQVGTGITFNYGTDVRFSNAVSAPTTFAACTYVPTSGYDANVRHICVNPKGTLLGSTSAVSFTLFFRAQIG